MEKANILHILYIHVLTSIYSLETSGRTLEEVDHIFENSTGVLSAVRASKNLPKQHSARLGVAVLEKQERGTSNVQNLSEVSEGNGAE